MGALCAPAGRLAGRKSSRAPPRVGQIFCPLQRALFARPAPESKATSAAELAARELQAASCESRRSSTKGRDKGAVGRELNGASVLLLFALGRRRAAHPNSAHDEWAAGRKIAREPQANLESERDCVARGHRAPTRAAGANLLQNFGAAARRRESGAAAAAAPS